MLIFNCANHVNFYFMKHGHHFLDNLYFISRMKQTNNAIKFLMAQYRAIFKNANIAMVAAIAAAALAAGQAQAAGDFNNDKLANATGELTFVGASSVGDKQFDHLTLSGAAAVPTSKEVTFILQSGAGHTLKGNSGAEDGKINLSAATIRVEGNQSVTDVKNNKLTIGESDKPTTVSLGTLSIAKGTVEVLGATDVGNKNTINAANITVGGESSEDKKAVLQIRQNALVTASDELHITKGADVLVGASATLAGKKLNVDGGNISFNTGTLGDKDSNVVITGGTLSLADGSGGTVTGSSVKLSDKAVVDNSGSITFAGQNVQIIGGTINNKVAASKVVLSGTSNTIGAEATLTNSGTLSIQGNTTIDAAVDKIKIDSGAKLVIGVQDNKTPVTATMSKDVLVEFLKGTNIEAASGSVAVIKLKDETVDLASGNLVLQNNGTLNAKYKDNTTGNFTFSGQKAEFKAGKELNNKGTFDFDTMTLGKDGALEVKGGAQLKVGSSLAIDGSGGTGLTVTDGAIFLDGGKGGSVTAKAVILNGTGDNADKATLNILNGGEWTVAGDLTLTAGKVSVTDSTLKVTGDLTTTASKGSIQADNAVIDTVGGKAVTLATGGVTLKNTAELKLESKDFLKDNALDPTKFTGAIAGDSNTTITIDGGNLELDKTKFDALATAVGDGFKGLFNVKLTGVTNAEDGMELGAVANKVTSEAYEKVSVKQDSAKDVVQTNKSVGSVELTGGNKLSMGENTSLTISNAKNGKFVYTTNDSSTTTGSVVFKNAGNSLTLAGTGEIGSITVESSADAGTVTIGKANKTGAVTVKGNIGDSANNSRVVGVTVNNNSSLKANNVYTTKLDLSQGSALTTTATDGVVDVAGAATIMGNVDAGTLKLGATSTIAGNASVDVATLDLAGSQTLTIGKDGDAEGKGSSSAAVFADTFIMGAGSTLFVDPAYTEKASILAVQTIQSDASGTDVSVAKGNIVVGKNAAFGYGFDQAGFESVMADYLVDGKFIDPKKNIGGVANAFVLNKPLTIKSGNYVAVDANLTAAPATPTLNSLTLGKNSALIVTESAFEGGKAALTFGKIAATGGENVTDAKVIASENAKISLVGTFTVKSKDIKIFEAAQGTSGGGQVAVSGQAVTVEALGGLLTGTLAVGTNAGTLTGLSLSNDAETLAYDGVARPVGDMLLGIAKAEFDTVDNSIGYKFVTTAMGLPGGYKAIDAAAHAATYAGAQQAAVASVTTMADAMFGRVGAVGVEAASISATGSQANGGVWLTPMYKSVDSDGFNAEGASYGADVDLSGVAFGTDTVNGNMRFGAVFNIGSGDAEGKGNGNGLKDEFDYYGFGIYSAMGFGNFALVGDASMTVISHEVEGLGLRGKADTTAVTMGVTGQYTVATPVVDVTPHLGARFIRLSTDSYDLISANGVEGTTDFDVQNVFSVPLGVTLSKGFTTSGWTLAPSADLTIAFNTGDTEAKSNTFIAGKNIGLNTEVLDEVQYGVTLGLGAQYGAFGTSFVINYTGSSNTDSFGVNAQARYMF